MSIFYRKNLWSQLHEREYVLVSFLLKDSKMNVFGLWTNQDILGHKTPRKTDQHFIDQTTNWLIQKIDINTETVMGIFSIFIHSFSFNRPNKRVCFIEKLNNVNHVARSKQINSDYVLCSQPTKKLCPFPTGHKSSCRSQQLHAWMIYQHSDVEGWSLSMTIKHRQQYPCSAATKERTSYLGHSNTNC